MTHLITQITGHLVPLVAAAADPVAAATLHGDLGRGLAVAAGCAGAAVGVGLVGAKAAEAVGRNPDASGKILVQAILGMALAEAVAFYTLFLF